MTEEQRNNLNKEMSSDVDANNAFIARTGVTSKEAAQYAYRIVNQVHRLLEFN
jgi:hypothetical protein